jgi:hypothetical protein
VKKLPCDFVFFRVRPTGEIAMSDEGLPGFTRANRTLTAQRSAMIRISNKRKKSLSSGITDDSSLPTATRVTSYTAKTVTSTTTVSAAPRNKPQRSVHPSSLKWNNSLAVCALMKDEQLPDILEWLGYHRCASKQMLHCAHCEACMIIRPRIYQPGYCALMCWRSSILQRVTSCGQVAGRGQDLPAREWLESVKAHCGGAARYGG